MRYLLPIALLAAPGFVRAAESNAPLLLQKPSLSKTHIAFTFAGDLWIVGRDGGEARRLTSGVGLEFDPLFSPDGNTARLHRRVRRQPRRLRRRRPPAANRAA